MAVGAGSLPPILDTSLRLQRLWCLALSCRKQYYLLVLVRLIKRSKNNYAGVQRTGVILVHPHGWSPDYFSRPLFSVSLLIALSVSFVPSQSTTFRAIVKYLKLAPFTRPFLFFATGVSGKLMVPRVALFIRDIILERHRAA